MFGFGFGEILLLAAIGLIVLGPKQLPQVARVIGRTIGELKKALHDVTAQVAVNLDEENKKPKRNSNQHNASDPVSEDAFKPMPVFLATPPPAAAVPVSDSKDSVEVAKAPTEGAVQEADVAAPIPKKESS